MGRKSFIWFVAMRYLTAKRENHFFSWVTWLSVAGIAIGVAAMIVVMSVIHGFEQELRTRFLAANAHVLAYQFTSGMKIYPRWMERIEKDYHEDITGLSPFVHSDTMGRKDYIIHGVLVKGIDPERRKAVQDLSGFLRPPSALEQLAQEVLRSRTPDIQPERVAESPQVNEVASELPGAIVGSGLASIMEAKVGDTIELISPAAAEADPFANLQAFKIIGIYDSGFQHYDNKLIILSLPAAQNLFHLGELVTGLEIGLKDPDKSREVAAKMSSQYSISINEWQSYNRGMLEIIKSQKKTIARIVGLVAFVAGFNILTTLMILVSQKQREISILKALGASNRQVLTLFLTQGTLIGLVGTGIGLALATGISIVIEKVPIIQLPEVYYLSSLPVSYDLNIYLSVAGIAMFISAFAGLYPAWWATRITPTEGLTGTRRLPPPRRRAKRRWFSRRAIS